MRVRAEPRYWDGLVFRADFDPFFARRNEAHEAIQYGETMTDAERPSSFRHFGTEEYRELSNTANRLLKNYAGRRD